LGSRINFFPNYRACVSNIFEKICQHTGSLYVTVNNAHTLVEAVRHPRLHKIIEESYLSISDGRPLSIIGDLKGIKNIKRIFGPTLMEKTLEWGQDVNLRHFFFGNSRDTLEKMEKNIRERYPRAIICGMRPPPYRPFTKDENEAYIAEIRDARPDIIWVSLGAPKQEYWIYEHYRELDHGIFIGIGAGFSYLSGKIKHAPDWMKNFALEWLYRLIQEPFRLFRRYMVSNTLFIYYLLAEMMFPEKFSHSEKLSHK